MLRPLLWRHGPHARIVQVSNPHRKFQRVRTHEAPDVRGRHRLARDCWPTVDHGLRNSGRFLFGVQEFFAVLHRAARPFSPKKLLHATQLEPQDVLHLLITFIVRTPEVLVHAISTPRRQRPHRHQASGRHGRFPESAKAKGPLPLIRRSLHSSAHLRLDTAPQIHSILVLTHLQLGSLGFTCRFQFEPPPQKHLAQRALRRHQPFLKDLLCDLVRDLAATNCELRGATRAFPIRRAPYNAHFEASLVQLLSCPALSHNIDVDALLAQLFCAGRVHVVAIVLLRSVFGQDLLLGHCVEESRVVILMHRLMPAPTFAPRPSTDFRKTRECPNDLCHESPANLQTFQDLTVPNIPPHENHKILLHLLWVPGHLHARCQILLSLHTRPKLDSPIKIRKDQIAIHAHTSNSSCKNHATVRILHEALLLLHGGILPQPRRPAWVPRIASRPACRIHPVPDAELLQSTHPSEEATCFLWKRDRILPEHVHHRLPHRAEIHLHEIQSHKTCLGDRRLAKQPFKLRREVPTRIHRVQEGTLRHRHDLLTSRTFLPNLGNHVSVATQARAGIALRDPIHFILKGRQLGPRRHLHVTDRHTGRPLPQQMQIELRGGHVRRMKRRETLVTHQTPEHQHARQDRVHHLHGAERRLAQHNIELRHAKLHILYWNHSDAVAERRLPHLLLQHITLPLRSLILLSHLQHTLLHKGQTSIPCSGRSVRLQPAPPNAHGQSPLCPRMDPVALLCQLLVQLLRQLEPRSLLASAEQSPPAVPCSLPHPPSDPSENAPGRTRPTDWRHMHLLNRRPPPRMLKEPQADCSHWRCSTLPPNPFDSPMPNIPIVRQRPSILLITT